MNTGRSSIRNRGDDALGVKTVTAAKDRVMVPKIKAFLKKYPALYRIGHNVYPLLTFAMAAVRGRRGTKDHFMSTVSMLKKSPQIMGRPVNITLEPTNVCNLQCPVCETGAGILNRADGNMTFDEFKVIIDKVAAHTNTLLYYGMGEPFLNKGAYDMIRYAKNQGIPFITTCTNGDSVNPRKLVECGLDEVSFQIGGMTQKTHETYRVNSNLERVMKNLQESARLKRELGAKIRIATGLILMKHNEHEVDEFKRVMKEIGVDEATVIDPCVRTIAQGHQFLPTNTVNWFYDVKAFRNNVLTPKIVPKNKCSWIYYSLVIQVNGDVVPCCRDTTGLHVMGNLLQQDLDEVWNGEPFQNFRNKLHRDQRGIDICRLCSGYGVSKLQ